MENSMFCYQCEQTLGSKGCVKSGVCGKFCFNKLDLGVLAGFPRVLDCCQFGPTLPAFITPNILQVLVDKFGLKPITTPEEDLKNILG